MERIKIEDLVTRGSVFRVEDFSDSDNGKYFMCRGRKVRGEPTGYHIISSIGQEKSEDFGVQQLPNYKKLFRVQNLLEDVPYGDQPNFTYKDVLEHLNKHLVHLRDGDSLNLGFELDCRDLEHRGLGLEITQSTPKGSPLVYVKYKIINDLLRVEASMPFAFLEEKYKLSRISATDVNKAYEELIQLGLFITGNEIKEALEKIHKQPQQKNFGLNISIIRMPEEYMYFDSVLEAHDYIQELNEKLVQ